jgi:Core-2/I-Branching enzyme
MYTMRSRKSLLSIFGLILSPFALGRLGALPSALVEVDKDNDAMLLATCPSHCKDAAFHGRQKQKVGGFRILYLIILHNERTLTDAVHLFRSIRDPRNTILIHVDSKVQHLIRNKTMPTLLEKEIENCPCGSQVRLDSVHNVKWSHWSMNLPTLWGLQVAVEEYANQWDVFINLSADTLPVYTPKSMAEILSQLAPYNFVTSSSCETGLLPTNVYDFPAWWHKRAHYTRDDTEPDPVFTYQTTVDGPWRNQTLATYFGSQWVILQSSFCHWLIEQLRNKNSLPSLFAEYLQSSLKLMTDETYLPTLLVHVADIAQSPLPRTDAQGRLIWPKNGTTSEIRAVRYERMDEHVPTAFGRLWTRQRYDVSNASLADKPRPWGPYFLGVYDLAAVRASGALFARKISREVDHNLLSIFPVDRKEDIPNIDWPVHEVVLSPKPDWLRLARELAIEKVDEEEDEDDSSEEL